MPYEDDGVSSEGGTKGTYEIYKAEGDVLYKQGDYKKAIDSFNTALELRPGDKNCLVARSLCHLQLGQSDKALADANETLKEDKNYIKGLLQKAEAFYQMGQFEYALMFYHRGNKLRPEVQSFRLGIQKSQEAIDNSIGGGADIRLENKGDLTLFYEEQQQEKEKKQKYRRGYTKPGARKDDKGEQKRPRTCRDSATMKQLLGELYADREYLEKLCKEAESSGRKTETNVAIRDLALSGLDYLDTRTEFWQQQKPMYSRKRDENMRRSGKSRDSSGRGKKKDPSKWVFNQLEEIDKDQAEGRYEKSLKQAKRVLREVEKWSDNDVSDRPALVASLHSCLGNAYLELADYNQAIEHHNVDKEIATEQDLDDAKGRALDNLGRVYARMGKYDKAVEVWEEKVPMSKTALESTWLFHEIGRCYLETGKHDQARDYGERSLAAAEEASDDIWQLNASVLVAQAQVKSGDLEGALGSFEKSLDMAKLQGDDAAASAITRAIDDVNNKIARGIKEGDNRDDDEDRRSQKSARSQGKDSSAGQDKYEDDFEKDEVAEDAKSHTSRSLHEEDEKRTSDSEDRKSPDADK